MHSRPSSLSIKSKNPTLVWGRGMSLVFVVLKNIVPQWKKVSQRSCWKWKLLTYFTQHCFYYTDILRRVVRKSACNNPERYCGWFWVHCSSRKFERIAREEMDVCLWVLKESNKSRFSSYSIRNNVLIIYHIAFWDCRVHIFSDNLSWNSSIPYEHNSLWVIR